MNSPYLVNLNCCRICSETSNKMIRLFRRQTSGISPAEVITRCTKLSIQQSDDRPTQICLECNRKLNDVYEFWELAISSEEKFQQMTSAQQTKHPKAIESVFLVENEEKGKYHLLNEANSCENECESKKNALNYVMDTNYDVKSEHIDVDTEQEKDFENILANFGGEKNILVKSDKEETEKLNAETIEQTRQLDGRTSKRKFIGNDDQLPATTFDRKATKSNDIKKYKH